MDLLQNKIEIMFKFLIIFLCKILLSFCNRKAPLDKPDQRHQATIYNTGSFNDTITISNIGRSFGDETMRSVVGILSRHKQLQEKSLALYRRSLNNTNDSDQSYIIFNRVAKSGSETLR